MLGLIFWFLFFIIVVFGLRRLNRIFQDRPRELRTRLEDMIRANRPEPTLDSQRDAVEQSQYLADGVRYGYYVLQSLAVLMLLWQVISTSLFYVGEYETAHVIQKWGGPSLPNGAIIAANGENGPQAYVYGPGWKFVPMIKFYADIEMLPAVRVPAGMFGEVVALDGRPLPEDAVIASPLPGTSIAPNAPKEKKVEVKTEEGNVIHSYAVFDAEAFLKQGYGYKGLQSTVLKPGLHRLNLYLFNVRITSSQHDTWTFTKDGVSGGKKSNDTPTVVTEIPTGNVGVIKSNMTEGWRTNAQCYERADTKKLGELTAVLVPDGCKGVWRTTFEPGAYFFNPAVYEVTNITTRAQRWTYKGGFNKCGIDLTVSEDGSFKQERQCWGEKFDPREHADEAIPVKVEGWEIPVELRVLVQVKPQDAPAVVAAVGSVKEIEDRIVTPSIRSVVRNIGGGSYNAPVYENGFIKLDDKGAAVIGWRPARALDLQDHREFLERAFEDAIIIEARKAGLTILEVKIGEPAIPPELLVSRRREQLAQQLARAFQQEKLAQDERVKTANARSTADQQPEIVRVEVELVNSKKQREARHNAGMGERDFLLELAAGQRAQAGVLGEDRVAMLKAWEMFLAALKDRPELVRMFPNPNTLIIGGSDISQASALISNAMSGVKK